MSGIAANNKTYDRAITAGIDVSGAGGWVVGDDVTVATTGLFSDKNVGSGKTVTLTSSYGGVDKNNYTITDQGSTTAAITEKSITISGITASNKIYDQTTVVGVDSSGASGWIVGDDVTVATTGVFSDKNKGSGKTVNLSSSYGGSDKDNYTITNQSTTTANITAKPITISGLTANDKIYNSLTDVVVNVSGAVGWITGDDVTVTTTGVFTDKNVAAGKTVNLSSSYGGVDKDNYAITDQTATTANISTKELNVIGLLSSDKSYDGNPNAQIFGTAVLQNEVSSALGSSTDRSPYSGDDLLINSGSVSAEFNEKNVLLANRVSFSGLALSGTDAGNYKLLLHADVSNVIRPKTVELSANRIYDGTIDLTGNDVTITTGVGSETLNHTGGTSSSKDVAVLNKYIDGITLENATDGSGGLSSNYQKPILNVSNAPVTITKKTVNLSANRIYDGTIDLTGNDVTITTGVGSETLSYSGGTSSSKDVAILYKYIDGITLENAIDGSGGLSSNYQNPSLDAVNAPVTISKKMVNLSASRIYDGTIDLIGTDVTITTGVGSETLSHSGTSASSKDVAVSNKYIDAVTLVDATDGSGGLASNYKLPSLDGINAPAIISAKTVGLSASRIYNGSINLTGGDLTIATGVGSETLNYSGAVASSKDVAVSNKYINAITLVDATDGSGGLGSNYKLPSLDSVNAPVTISEKTVGLSASKIYDAGVDLTGYITLSTGVGSETLSYSAATASAKDVAVSNKYIDAITLVNAIDGSGGLASNYQTPTLGAINAPVTISEKVVGLSASRIYDGSINLSGSDLTITTGVGSETLNYSGATASSKDVVVSNKYIDAITLVDATDGTGGLASNYKIPALDASNAPVVITEKVVSLSASKIYDAGVDLAGYVTLITGVGSETLNYSGATASSKDVAMSNKYIDNITLENSLDGSGGVASNYQIPILDAIKAPVTINEKTVSLSAERIYDGTMDLVGTDVRITTGVGSETLSYRGARSSSKDVAASNKYIDNISLENAIDGSGGLVTNYKLPTLNAGNSPVTINPKTVGLFAERIYDGTIDLTESDVVITTGVGGETLTHIGSTSSSKDVAVANKYIDTISLTDAVDGSGGMASNYNLPSLDSINAPVSITEKTVGLSASRIYDGTADLTGTDVTITTGIGIENLTHSGTISSSKDVAVANKYINAITLRAATDGSGGLDSNYKLPSLDSVNAPVTISRKTVNLSANKIYDADMDLTGYVTLNTGVGSETLSYRGARSSSKDVAASNKYIDNISLENAIDGSGGLVTNYKLPTLNAGNSPVTINPKTVGLFAERIYDGTIDLTESDVVITTGVGGETLTHIGSTSSSKDVAVANKYIDTISLTDAVDGSGGLASNYNLPSLDSINAPVTISKKTVGLSASRIYDTSETLTGADIIISTGVKGEKLNFSGATASSKDVAELDKYISAITLEDMSESSGGLASNYIIPVLNKLTAPVTIQPASLYVKAKDEIKTYGREAILDEEAFEVNGLQGGEEIFFVSMFSEGRNENAGLGTYDIVPNLARGPNFIPSNYSITYNPGTLIIEASPFEQKTALVTVELAQNNVVSVDPSLTTNVSSTPFTPEDIVPEVPPLINSPLPVTSTPTAEPTVVESTPTPTPTSSPTPTAPEPSPEPVTETVSTPPEPTPSPAPVASPTDTGSSNNVPGLTVDLLDTPDSSTVGLIAVSVPKTTTTQGAGFSFELPTEISSITKKTDVSVEVTMESGAPLPSWLSYQQDSGKFSSASVPEGAFPVTVIMKIGDQQVAVVISERQD